MRKEWKDRDGKERFVLWLIILIVSLKSAEERELWEPEEYTKTLTHKGLWKFEQQCFWKFIKFPWSSEERATIAEKHHS